MPEERISYLDPSIVELRLTKKELQNLKILQWKLVLFIVLNIFYLFLYFNLGYRVLRLKLTFDSSKRKVITSFQEGEKIDYQTSQSYTLTTVF